MFFAPLRGSRAVRCSPRPSVSSVDKKVLKFSASSASSADKKGVLRALHGSKAVRYTSCPFVDRTGFAADIPVQENVNESWLD